MLPKGLRLNAALYRDHPEFASGECVVDVIASGRLLVRANGHEETAAEEVANPTLFTPIDRAQVALIESLVEGVDADDDTEFPADFRVP